MKTITLFIAIALVVGLSAGCDSNKKPYEDAVALLDGGQYTEAAAAFEALGDYNDAVTKALESRYALAAELYYIGNYEDAANAFEAIGDYSDAAAQVLQSKYALAVALFDSGDFEEAAAAFEALGDYNDASTKAIEAKIGTVFPIVGVYGEYNYIITGYRIGKIDGSTAVMLLGEDIFVILSFGEAATLPVPHVSCAFEVEGKEYNSADIAVSSDGSAVSWVFKTVAYPETIIIRDRTGVEVCSFKVDDIPQTP